MIKILDAKPKEIVKAIHNGDVTITVVGLGHVGLPLALLFAEEGAKVIGTVRTTKSAERINQGKAVIIEFDASSLLQEDTKKLEALCPSCGIPFFESNQETFCPYCGRHASVMQFGVHLGDTISTAYQKIVKTRRNVENRIVKALKSGRLKATIETTDAVRQSHIVLITVGSPIDEKNIPNYTDLENACHAVGKGLQRDNLVVLKTTVSPGTTQNLVKPILEKESLLEAGRDFGLAFMPETIYEGHALYDIQVLPRIVGGITKRCAQAAANLFSIFPAPVHIYENIRVVEAAKLFMNVYRDVNIALANELALICEKLDIDVIKAINAANVEQKTHLLIPGLVGGYCLPKDSYHLIQPAETRGCHARLITLARQINDALPNHILELVDEAFKQMGLPIRGARIAVLGLGFKANSGNLRNTPAVPIIKGLLERGVSVIAHDPFADFDEVNQIFPELFCTRNLREAVRDAACTLIITDHLKYRELTVNNLKKLMTKPCAIVDGRHILDPLQVPSGVIFRGFGKPETKSFSLI